VALFIYCVLIDLFADTEYLRLTLGTSALIGRASILHRDPPRIVHLYLLPALHTIRLHFYLLSPLYFAKILTAK